MKKKLLCALLCVVTVASLVVGCGNSKEAAENTPTETKKEEVKEEAEKPADSSNEPSGMVMMYSSMQEDQLIAVKEAFEKKYPNVNKSRVASLYFFEDFTILSPIINSLFLFILMLYINSFPKTIPRKPKPFICN